MGIEVTNSSRREVQVSINTWGNGNTNYHKIKPKETKSWKRSDPRGFVMALKQEGTTHPYYVLADSKINIFDDKVTDHGRTIERIKV